MSAFGTFNTGHDVAIEIVDPTTGIPLLIPIKTGWEKKQRTQTVESKPLDGPPIFEEDPDGWEGSFDVDRSNSVVDDFFGSREDLFYSGRTVRQATILETMSEVGGGFTQWRYTGVALKLDEAGRSERGKTVVLKIAFTAGRRIKIQ